MICPICGNNENTNVCSCCGFDSSNDCELYPRLSKVGKPSSSKSALRRRFYLDSIKKSNDLETRVAELERSMRTVLEMLSQGYTPTAPEDEKGYQSGAAVKTKHPDNNEKQGSILPASEKVTKQAENDEPTPAANESGANGSMKPWDTVSFGKFMDKPMQWFVIGSSDKGVLLLSKYIIEHKSFQDCGDSPEGESAQSIDLPQWLDGPFFSESFSKEEKSHIIPCKAGGNGLTVPSRDNTGDNASKVFLLSTADYNRYRNELGIRTFLRSAYDIQRCAGNKNANPNTWWLRSSGDVPGTVACVDKNGSVYDVGHLNGYLRGVRPAVFVASDRIN